MIPKELKEKVKEEFTNKKINYFYLAICIFMLIALVSLSNNFNGFADRLYVNTDFFFWIIVISHIAVKSATWIMEDKK